MFESFWTFIGTLLIIALIGDIIVEAIKAFKNK